MGPQLSIPHPLKIIIKSLSIRYHQPVDQSIEVVFQSVVLLYLLSLEVCAVRFAVPLWHQLTVKVLVLYQLLYFYINVTWSEVEKVC